MSDDAPKSDVPEGGEPDGGSPAAPPADGEAPPETPAKKRGRGRRVLKWTALSLAVILVVAGGAGYVYYRKLQGNITKEDINGLLGRNRPKKQSEAVNILLIGSDSRAGENSSYGSLDGARADTTILLHLSPGGEKAIGMSFPRDLMVDIPECKKKKGAPSPAQFGMINSAFAVAGPSCTWQTIESITQIHIDHYVVIDFSGFKRVVDALGGVEICLPHAVNDPKADLDLKAGRQVVKGAAALGYVRTRTGGLGNGSDLSRIDRQKKFMSAVVQKATSSDMLSDPTKFVRFLNAATKSISTDKDFSVGDMRKLAGGIKGMEAGGVKFVTVPFGPYAPDPNRVSLDKTRAEPLFEAIRKDTKVPDAAPAPVPPAAGNLRGVKPVRRNLVKVQVYNGGGVSGLAVRVGDQLQAEHFKLASRPGPLRTGIAPKTQILYGRGAARQAVTLATLVPGVPPAAHKSVPPGVVYLVLGKDWKGLKGLAPTGANEIRADQNICKGDDQG